MSTPVSSRVTPGAPGSARARLRLGAVILMGLLAAVSLVLALAAYLAPSGSPVAGAIVGVFLGACALAYALLARAVATQSRVGHITAVVACGLGAVLSVSPGMGVQGWATLLVNVAATGLLLGSLPRKAPAQA